MATADLLRFSILASLVLVSAGVAQVTWVDKTPATGGPGERSGHAMAYDAARGQTVLFGGYGSGLQLMGDTWAWNGSTWTRLATAGPSPRHSHAMAYDAARQRVVLFGGHDASSPRRDTWEWDGAAWTNRDPARAPTVRYDHDMAYYPPGGQTVLFGGLDARGGMLNDTWVWNGTDWAHRSPGNAPVARYGHSLAYDSVNQAVVLFGGYTISTDTCLWDGSRWIKAVLAGLTLGGTGADMVFDSKRGRAVLYGGRGFLFNGYPTWTYAWSGTWVDLEPPQNPGGRQDLAMAYDAGRDRVVMHGGFQDFSYYRVTYGDTWELEPYTPAPPHTQAQLLGFGYGGGCLSQYGSTALFIANSGLAWINEPFSLVMAPVGLLFGSREPAALFLGSSNTMWGSVALPAPLTSLGLPNCHLLVSPDVVLPTMSTPGGASWNLQTPNCASCVGVTLHMQGVAVEEGALLVSNGLSATVGQR